MRIIAFSDTHGMSGAVLKLFSETYDKTDLYIFCGDGIRDIEYAKKDYPDIKIVMARGASYKKIKRCIERAWAKNPSS